MDWCQSWSYGAACFCIFGINLYCLVFITRSQSVLCSNRRQGGGFWKKGQQGSLTTYADEVLAKKKNKSVSIRNHLFLIFQFKLNNYLINEMQVLGTVLLKHLMLYWYCFTMYCLLCFRQPRVNWRFWKTSR